MYRGASLAGTGVGVVVLGQHIQMGWLIGFSVAAITVGCLTYRIATRHKRIKV